MPSTDLTLCLLRSKPTAFKNTIITEESFEN